VIHWMTGDKYAIEARAPENSGIYTLYDIEDARLRALLQTPLIDRFHLRVHRETKTGDERLRPLRLHAEGDAEGDRTGSARADAPEDPSRHS
jgi:uncharacterized protein DUF3738